MFFYIIVIVAAIGFGAWWVRTPSFRAHFGGHGKDPGDSGTRVDGKFPGNGGSYYFDGPPK
jgi:hypothetical protein